MNVLAIQGRDEGGIQLGKDAMSDIVSLMLDVMNLVDERRHLFALPHQGKTTEKFAGLYEIVRRFFEQGVKLVVFWEEFSDELVKFHGDTRGLSGERFLPPTK